MSERNTIYTPIYTPINSNNGEDRTKEGSIIIPCTSVLIPSRKQTVFYNEQMSLNRTITRDVINQGLGSQLQVALPLAGSGVRAGRLIKELPPGKIAHMYVNDLKEEAVVMIKELFNINTIPSSLVTISQQDCNKFFHDKKGFDYIDIDPFGSPNIVLEQAILHAKNGAIIGITATDTGALSGTYPLACKQKYQSCSTPNSQQHEIGIRILARRVIQLGMGYAKQLVPILSFHHKHYYRIFFKVKKGKQPSANMFNSILSYVHECPQCGLSISNTDQSTTCDYCAVKMTSLGPLYSGILQDTSFLKQLLETSNDSDVKKLLQPLYEEAFAPSVGFYNTHHIAKKKRIPVKPLSEIIIFLQDNGYDAVKSAFNSVGIKTTAPAGLLHDFFLIQQQTKE
ncbi:MAG: hypothetical protein ACQESC_00505 [Nanobdellota archaeon]